MRLVFAGTPDFACPCLSSLLQAGHSLACVVTQPDRPRGRGCRLTSPPIKLEAECLGLETIQPLRIDTDEFRCVMNELAPEALVVVAYGLKIPGWLLALPRYGCINVHASLLPRYRGAAPIQRSIMNGDRETGVTIMRLDEGWDTGPIFRRRSVRIEPDDNAGKLHDRLALIGADLLVEVLAELEDNKIEPEPQDDAQATPAPKIQQEETRLDWREPAFILHNLVRALSPAPLAETYHGDRRLKIVRTRLTGEIVLEEKPGTVLEVTKDEVTVQTGRGVLTLTEVKPANRSGMTAGAYARGCRLGPGTLLGTE